MRKKIVASLVLFFIGCGSGGSDSNKKKSIDEALKIGDVVYSAPQNIDFQNKTRLTLKRHKKMRNKLLKIKSLQEKAETTNCSISGTVDVEMLSDGSLSVLYHECVNHNNKTGLSAYYDGKIQTNAKGNQISFYNLTEIPDYENYPQTKTYYHDIKMSYSSEESIEDIKINGKLDVYENGILVERMNYSDFTIKSNLMNNSYYMAGNFADKMRCHAEQHKYKTKNNDWLVDDSNNDKKIISGTLHVDELQYVYQKETVEVTKDEQQGTFTQQALIDGYNENKAQSECSVSYL